MLKIHLTTRRLIVLLAFLALGCLSLYILPLGGHLSAYAFNLRVKKLLAYGLVAIIASFSTVSFQTMTGNRFLTPSVLGLESLYVLFQSTYFFFFWRGSSANLPQPQLEFALVMTLLLGFVQCLQPFIHKLLHQGFGVILLICMALGTLFRSLSTFMQVLMDPNEYDKLQSRLFASFQHINEELLMIVLFLTLVIGIFLTSKRHVLDVLLLGSTNAQLLGVDVMKTQKQILWSVVILTAASTALIGPMSFFGFTVTNLVYLCLKDYRHGWFFLVSTLLGFVTLVLGQMMVERLFNHAVTISMIVELVGGAFFFFLLAKERIRT